MVRSILLVSFLLVLPAVALAEPFEGQSGDGPADGGRGAAAAVALAAAFGPIGLAAAVIVATGLYKGGPGKFISDLNFYARDFKRGIEDVVRGYTEGYVGTEVRSFREGIAENPGETIVSYALYPEHVLFGYTSGAVWNTAQRPVGVADKVGNYFGGPAVEGHVGRSDGRTLGELAPFLIPGSRLPRAVQGLPEMKLGSVVPAVVRDAKGFLATPRILGALKQGLNYEKVKAVADTAIVSMLRAPVSGLAAAAVAVRRFATVVRGSEAVKQVHVSTDSSRQAHAPPPKSAAKSAPARSAARASSARGR